MAAVDEVGVVLKYAEETLTAPTEHKGATLMEQAVVVEPNFPEETAEPLGQVPLQEVKQEPLDKVDKADLGVQPQVAAVAVVITAVAVAEMMVAVLVPMAAAAAVAVLPLCPLEDLALVVTIITTDTRP